MRPVLIIGGGGHAKVLIDALRLTAVRIIGIVEADPRKQGMVSGVAVLGDDSVVDRYPPDAIELVNAVGSVHVPRARKELFERFKRKGYTFAVVIHPSAVIAGDVELGEGAQIMAGAVIQTGSTIGRNSIINTRASVDHDCIIGEHVHVAPGATLSGSVRVGDTVHIGTAASIIQSVTIGHESIIAAGAVVVADTPDRAKMVGVPAGNTQPNEESNR